LSTAPCCVWQPFFEINSSLFFYFFTSSSTSVFIYCSVTFVPLPIDSKKVSKTPIVAPQKANRSARRSIWRYLFEAGVRNCQILNQVVESQLFTSLWIRCYQCLSDIELIQSAFLRFLYQD
jgi:hypothetical protein